MDFLQQKCTAAANIIRSCFGYDNGDVDDTEMIISIENNNSTPMDGVASPDAKPVENITLTARADISSIVKVLEKQLEKRLEEKFEMKYSEEIASLKRKNERLCSHVITLRERMNYNDAEYYRRCNRTVSDTYVSEDEEMVPEFTG